MATWWTITIPPTLTDVTAEDSTQALFKPKIEQIQKAGGTVDLHMYASEDGAALIVLDTAFADMPQKISVMEGFESGARKTSFGTGHEIDYAASRTDTFIIGKQHAINTGNIEAWHQRWAGAGTDGNLHSLGVSCVGSEAMCKATLASVKVDPTSFKKLASLSTDAGPGSAYVIGYAVGGGLVLLGLIAALVKARSRARA